MLHTRRLDTVIETPRLLLRVPGLAEFEAWSAFMADEEEARFIGQTQPPALVWRGIATMAELMGDRRGTECSQCSREQPAGGLAASVRGSRTGGPVLKLVGV